MGSSGTAGTSFLTIFFRPLVILVSVALNFPSVSIRRNFHRFFDFVVPSVRIVNSEGGLEQILLKLQGEMSEVGFDF